MLRRSLFAALALTCTAAPLAAQDLILVEVNVADLDLSAPEDRARFETRLKHAARNACRVDYETPGARAAEKRCIEEVMTSARAETE